MKYGYIPLSRHVLESKDWFTHRKGDERKASTFEAWLDLIFMAAFKERKYSVGFTTVTLQPGELMASIRFLAKRWHWSRDRTHRYITWKVSENELKRMGGRNLGHLKIVNYNAYNNEQDNGKTTIRQAYDNDKTKQNKVKNVNKENKEESGDDFVLSVGSLAAHIRHNLQCKHHGLEYIREQLETLVSKGVTLEAIRDHLVSWNSTGDKVWTILDPLQPKSGKPGRALTHKFDHIPGGR